jgi:hypothetical protein
MYRQGDILIIPISKLPEGLETVEKDNGRHILAYGEVTGHAHAVEDSSKTEMFIDLKSSDIDEMRERFLKVDGETAIVHEEHSQIPLGPGYFKIVRQVEYQPEGYRYIAD